jgi:signal transduction histidine kinase
MSERRPKRSDPAPPGTSARFGIRARLAIVYAVLAGTLVVGVLATVALVERRDHAQALRDDARAAALQLLVAAGRDGDAEEASRSAAAYTDERRRVDALLLVAIRDATPVVNRTEALGLVPLIGDVGGQRTTLDGHTYQAWVLKSGRRTAIAALPTAPAQRELESFFRRLLQIGVLGLVLTVAAAWFTAHRLLAPLARVADGAARISAGDLDQRVSDPRYHHEIAQVATAIDAMLARLEEAFARQQRFVHDASHELRTPLTIARGHLEVLQLQRDPSPDEVRATIDLAIAELTRMGHMVDGLLTLARMEEEGGVVRPQAVPVRGLVERAVRRAAPIADGRTISATVADAADVDVVGDAGALDGVLLNLVTNAVRHTGDAGRIELSAERSADTVRIAVADDGEGIEPDFLPHVFDRFSRADGARQRDTGGVGIGLAIARLAVEAHGGTIDVASQLGVGTTFTITLPVRREYSARPHGPLAASVFGEGTGAAASK